jgi:Na+/proline symporter
MVLSIFIVIVKGMIDVKGFDNFWKVNSESGRLRMFDFNTDPFIRQSTWALFIGLFFYAQSTFVFSQQMIQRFSASKSKRQAQASLLLSAPGVLLLLGTSTFVGLLLNAFYKDCDPLTAKLITNPNQLLSYYVDLRLGAYWGVSGIFLGSLFSSALSSVSSVLNSSATVVWQDYLKHFSHFKKNNHTLDLYANKILVLVLGALATGFAFFLSNIGDNLLQISTTLNSALIAPIVGVFWLASFTSICDKWGAVVGIVCSCIVSMTISFGIYINPPNYPNTKLPVSVELCYNSTDTFYNDDWSWNNKFPNYTIPKPGRADNLEGVELIFGICFQWIAFIGIIICFISGIIASIVNQKIINRKTVYKIDKKLVIFDLTKLLSRKEDETIKDINDNFMKFKRNN